MKQKVLLIVSAILIAIAYILFLTTNLFAITQTYVSPFSDPIRETYKIGIFSLLFGYDLQQRFNPTILIYLFLIIASVVLFVFSIVIKNDKRKKLITLSNILANSFLLLLSIFLYQIADSCIKDDYFYGKHIYSITYFMYLILLVVSIVLLSFSLVRNNDDKFSLYEFIVNLVVSIALITCLMILINTDGAFYFETRHDILYTYNFMQVTFGMQYRPKFYNSVSCLPTIFIIASVVLSIVLMINKYSSKTIAIANYIKSFMLICAGVILICGQKTFLSHKFYSHYSFSTTWYKIGNIIFVIGLMCAILEAGKMIVKKSK